jgi:amino acid adenylation domain-containing protein
LIYTSGSTGRPKAVGITHRNAAALVDWAIATFPDDLSGGVLASTSICFDLSVYEIFGTLSCGGTVILAENALALPEIPAAGRVELINTVPSALAELLRLGPLPPSVRTVSLCGEPFSRHLADEIEARGIRRAVNYYGPTEDTVYSTWTQVPRGETLEPAIGRSIAGSRAYLLDPELRPVPLGARGALYLAGDGLARGYLGRPDLTAERFVPDPLGDPTGGRMYRTGDLARWRAAGQIEFLGRADRQIKVRGFRVEPAEIEAVLAELPRVAGAAVALRGGRLHAWLVPREGIAGEDLLEMARNALPDRLPRHMIPSLWTHLPALPYTPNGKLDHRALPSPGVSGDAAGADGYVPPSGPAEEILARIWAEVLGLPRVGAHDNFFRLGGDSILSIRVVARARHAGLEINPRQVFERQTVAELAAAATQIDRRPAPGAEAPAAFSLARLDSEALDRLLAGDPAIEDLYPLSPMQAGLLFHGLYAPATEIYLEQILCTLRGALDAGAFRRAWQRLLDRHGVLRTSFLWEGLDEPLQVVRRGIEMPWIEEDWRGEPDPDARLAAFAAADRQNPFDLRRAPLMRAALLRTAEREHRCVFSFHHLLADGWSLPSLFAELFALYTDRPLAAPVLPYRDFVAWLARRDRAADEQYWRQALAGIDGPTPLPWDAAEAPPSARADEFAQHDALLPEDATAALDAFARERGLTLNTVLQGAWGLLLARWSGEREVVFGAVTAGRPPELPGFETAIGLFINTLPVRLEAAPERPLAAWLAAHQRAQSEARQHEQAPLAEIQRWSGGPGREPLFHSLLVFENYPLDAAVAEGTGGLELADVQAVERTSYPLSLAIVPGRRLRLQITHDRRLEHSTGDRLLGWLTRLLDRFTAAPDRLLRDFELLSEAERAQILTDQHTSPALPAEPALQRFERWAAATPDAPAVRDAAETLSFAELDRRAERHAEDLRARGIEPGSCVPLKAERSAAVLVGMLGIWKAGAAWVAIDPSRPSPPAPLPQGALAYVLYTSGSTGAPKGVMVDHAALAHYLAWVDEVLLAPVGHRLPATSGLTFDAALKQLLGPLLAGREVRILPEETATRPGALAQALAAEGFTAWNGVPALWSAVLDAIEGGDAPRPEALERVLLGGEALSPGLVERTRRLLPRAEVWNLYGPTEATANATAARLAPGERVHLGTPLPGVRTYVLDRDGRLVPPGGSGELCLAGAGLARGYLGRPDLTAERFLPEPFGDGGRLYHTGDLVRLHANGLLEHRGRIDSQVKIRGVRIEPGEIDAVLRSHPSVRDAAVTVRRELPGEVRLAAWIESTADPTDLKAWLRERLPAAAVPADLVLLPDLPRLPNGKIDRRALASREPEAGAGRPFEAPANEVEEKLAGLWRDLLHAERVGRGDNFFDLGGHSLLATRLMVRVRDAFGVALPLPAIFEADDLAALAGEILALRLRAENPDDLAHLMAELDGLSDDQVESLLSEIPKEGHP